MKNSDYHKTSVANTELSLIQVDQTCLNRRIDETNLLGGKAFSGGKKPFRVQERMKLSMDGDCLCQSSSIII